MKLIVRIARTELATLFYSPIAWLILIVFACQVGFDFMEILESIAKIKALGRQITFSATAGMLLGTNGLYEVIQKTLYLYIPLLTMSLMSREYASGSIKLLYSSPVTSLHIILGKYLSMVIYSLLLTVILFLPVLTLIIGIPNIDMPLVFSGLLGLFLLICTYCSIGLFMSTLTSYQVVAAVATLSALAFLSFVGDIGQEYGFIREITYWLSITGRASEMVGGLICSDDVIYFISVIALFLSLSILKINNEKTHYSIVKKVLRYTIAVLIVTGVGYISSRPAMMSFYDATRVDQRTLSIKSQEVMNQLEGSLTITTYANILYNDFSIASPENVKSDQSLFKMYTRFKPEIEMNYVYYYNTPKDSSLYKLYPGKNIDEIAKEVARKKNFNFKKLKKAEDLRGEINLEEEGNGFVRLIERGSGEKSILRIYDDMFRHPSETEISAALKKLVVAPVKVGFIIGHGERDAKKQGDKDYSIFASRRTFRNAMINQGYDLIELDLSTITEVPTSIDILLIAEMRQDMTPAEEAVLDHFIARGGNLMIMADINRQAVMNPILAKFGIAIEDGILVQPSDIYSADLLRSRGTEEAAKLLGGIYRTLAKYAKSVITMPGAVALKSVAEKGYEVTPLLVSEPTEVWMEYQSTDFVNDTVRMDTSTGEKLGAYVTSLALRRKVNEKEQRIIIVGDADCISNSELLIGSRTGFNAMNFNMIPGNFRWLCYDEFPVSVSRAANTDTDIRIGPKELPMIWNVYVWIIPLLLAAIGIFIWFRRRRG